MDQPVDGRLYSGPEACRAASISYRQLDYWDRTGILKPTQPARGSGTVRGYSLDEVVALAALGHMSAKGGRIGLPGCSLPTGMLEAVATGAPIIARDPGARREVVGVRDMDDLAALVGDGAVVTVLAVEPLRERVRQVLAAIPSTPAPRPKRRPRTPKFTPPPPRSPEPLAYVPCPTCLALPGAPCRSGDGSVR